MRLRLTFLLLYPFALACSDTAPTDIDGAAPNLAVAGNSGCYTVKFDFHGIGVFPTFTATTTGDLEATVDVVFDVGSNETHGVVIFNQGDITYHVTGGIIPALVGLDFETTGRPLTILQPDNEPLVSGITGTEKAVAGVKKANLTFRGTFDVRNGPPFPVELKYNGVICP